MGLFTKIGAGITQWGSLTLIDWIPMLIAAVVFVGVWIAGTAAFGPEGGWGIGIVSALFGAYVSETHLKNRLISTDQ